MIDYLKPQVHDPLISQLQFIAEQARIPESYIRHVGAKEYCTEPEMVWIRNAKKNLKENDMGMIFHGPQVHSISKKMLAIGATLTRNYIDARVYTLAEVLDSLDSRSEEPPDCTVLIIPDFCVADYDIPKRLVHKLYGFLINRFVTKKGMIAYIDSYEVMANKYGATLTEYINGHYQSFSCLQEQPTE
jgi:hypothetical protein